MVIVEKDKVESIPLLHVVKKSEKLEKLPLVIFIHGFQSIKERNLHYAYLLADAGFRVLLPEVLYHGEREQGLNDKEFYARFWEMVLNTIDELKMLKESYLKKGLIDSEKIGLAGTSMGGIVTLGALTQYKWIKTAVSLMGMPSYEEFSLWQLEQLKSQGITLPFTEEQIDEQLRILREYDLSTQPEKLDNRPLLFWHGKRDPLVPYPLTYQFYEKVKPNYQGDPERFRFISDQRAGHNVSLEGVEATVKWFINYLQ